MYFFVSATVILTCTAPADRGQPRCPADGWWRCLQLRGWGHPGWRFEQRARHSASLCRPASAASSHTLAWAGPGASAAWPPPLSHIKVKKTDGRTKQDARLQTSRLERSIYEHRLELDYQKHFSCFLCLGFILHLFPPKCVFIKTWLPFKDDSYITDYIAEKKHTIKGVNWIWTQSKGLRNVMKAMITFLFLDSHYFLCKACMKQIVDTQLQQNWKINHSLLL